MRDTPRDLTVVYLKGVAMGVADSIPGVSGGTIALITGIYTRLLDSLTAVGPRRIRDVLAAPLPSYRERSREAFLAMDLPFLLALGAGILTALVAVTGLVHYALEYYPVPTFGFFLGLIAASAVVLWGTVQVDTPGRAAAALAGFAFAFVVSGEAVTELGHSPAVTFLAGTVAVSAMILPGISGSLILFILGQYVYMTGVLDTLRSTVVGVVTGEAPAAAMLGPGSVAVTFVAGAVVGLFTVAHAVRWALSRYHEATLAFLVSLIVGALRAPYVQLEIELAASGARWTPSVVAVVALAALLGGAAVVAIERQVDGVEY